MITTTQLTTQNDIKQYLLQCNIADLTEDKIFFGWKQNKQAQLKQWQNKYNITIINEGKQIFGVGAKTKIINNDNETIKTNTYRAENRFVIKVFNWYGSLGDGSVKSYYDCEEIFLQVADCFINRANVIKYHILEPQSGFHEVFASSFLEYGLEITLYNTFKISKNNTETKIDNAILNKVEVMK